jgi:flagellar basal-body rod protein FlgG
MERGLYIAASGMLAEQIRQDQIANDLANAATAGYKADRTAQTQFGDLLLRNSVTGETIGTQSTAVQTSEIRTDWTPTAVRDTGEPLDFAVVGQGFFAVQADEGTRYTRNGQFMLSADGTLQTDLGQNVLGRDGGPIKAGVDGKVDPRLLDVVLLSDPAKQGGNLVTGTPVRGTTGQVRSQALEQSGADPARSMVDMIASLRAFEAGQKAIQTIDDTLGKSASQVGSLHG